MLAASSMAKHMTDAAPSAAPAKDGSRRPSTASSGKRAGGAK